MDLSQRANRVKRDLQSALAKPEAANVRHAVESFDAFVDTVVAEIAALKKASAPVERAPDETAGSVHPSPFATESDLRHLS